VKVHAQGRGIFRVFFRRRKNSVCTIVRRNFIPGREGTKTGVRRRASQVARRMPTRWFREGEMVAGASVACVRVRERERPRGRMRGRERAREGRNASLVSMGRAFACKWGRPYAAGIVPLRSTTRDATRTARYVFQSRATAAATSLTRTARPQTRAARALSIGERASPWKRPDRIGRESAPHSGHCEATGRRFVTLRLLVYVWCVRARARSIHRRIRIWRTLEGDRERRRLGLSRERLATIVIHGRSWPWELRTGGRRSLPSGEDRGCRRRSWNVDAGGPSGRHGAGSRQFSAAVAAAPRRVTPRYEKSQGLVDPVRRRVAFVRALCVSVRFAWEYVARVRATRVIDIPAIPSVRSAWR